MDATCKRAFVEELSASRRGSIAHDLWLGGTHLVLVSAEPDAMALEFRS